MDSNVLAFKRNVRNNIAKSFLGGIDIQKAMNPEFFEGVSDDFEKAHHNVGDRHPNGKWVWSEYKPGKFDWRGIKTKAGKEALQESDGKKSDKPTPPPTSKRSAGQEDNSSKKVKAKVAPEVKACRKAVRQIGGSGNFYSKGVQIFAHKNHLSGGYGFDFNVNPHLKNWEKNFDAVLKDFAKTYGITLPKNKAEKNKGLAGDVVFSWNLDENGKLK